MNQDRRKEKLETAIAKIVNAKQVATLFGVIENDLLHSLYDSGLISVNGPLDEFIDGLKKAEGNSQLIETLSDLNETSERQFHYYLFNRDSQTGVYGCFTISNDNTVSGEVWYAPWIPKDDNKRGRWTGTCKNSREERTLHVPFQMTSTTNKEAGNIKTYDGSFTLVYRNFTGLWEGSFIDSPPHVGSGPMIAVSLKRSARDFNKLLYENYSQLCSRLFMSPQLSKDTTRSGVPHLLIFCAKAKEETYVNAMLMEKYGKKGETIGDDEAPVSVQSWDVNPDRAQSLLARNWKITLATMHAQGLVNAALYFSWAINHFSPTYSFTIGICGGHEVGKSFLFPQARHGDIVRIDKGKSYNEIEVATLLPQVTKVMHEFSAKNKEMLVLDTTTVNSSVVLEEQASEMLRNIADDQHIRIKDLAAHEMEIYSVYKASAMFKVICIGALKNVSDSGTTALGEIAQDNKQDREAQTSKSMKIACEHAAMYLEYFCARTKNC